MIWYEKGPLTVFDVETTGMSPVGDRIVELAALRVDRRACRDDSAPLVCRTVLYDVAPGDLDVHDDLAALRV